MLTTSLPEAGLGTKVRIDVGSTVVRLALRYVALERGWEVCTGAHGTCRCVQVNDHCSSSTTVDVLVVRDTPSACQNALQAVLAGYARAVVLWDEPTGLTAALEALAHRATVIPERVIELAHEAPELTDRQCQTLRLVAAGRSNSEIAAALHQSTSTTKRDLGELLAVFDAANRTDLTTAAARLGFLVG